MADWRAKLREAAAEQKEDVLPPARGCAFGPQLPAFPGESFESVLSAARRSLELREEHIRPSEVRRPLRVEHAD